MELERIEKMKKLVNATREFIKDVSTPIKVEHGKNVENYIKDFIKFPGALSVVSIFFTSSSLVNNKVLAMVGAILIISSLLAALNILRKQLKVDSEIYKKIVSIENPMVNFSSVFTKFSRGESDEDHLNQSFSDLQNSYRDNSSEIDSKTFSANKQIDSIINQINVTYFLLVSGIILSFLSTVGFNFC